MEKKIQLQPLQQPCKKNKASICQEQNPKRSDNADRREVIYNDSYRKYESKATSIIDEKIVDADVKYVRKVERSVDRGTNMGLEKAET